MSTITPLPDAERIRSLDVMRGVAVLGIFVMNLRNFAMPIAEFDNPAFPEKTGAKAADLWSWGIANVFFEDKMIAIFSMLFGAGIVVMTARAVRPVILHYRRMFWLLLLGLCHAYLLWYGDILNTYAICGAILFPLRRLRPALLLGLGLAVLVVALWVRGGPAMLRAIDPPPAGAVSVESNADRIIREAGETEAKAYHGTWRELLVWRAKLNTFWHFYGVVYSNFWRCAGFMLIGMGLVQLGVLSAARPTSMYTGLMLGGYALGLTLCVFGFWPQLARALGRAPAAGGLAASAARYIGAGAMALGHVGLVMLLCRAGALKVVLAPLAAAGRMALSNYLMQTVIAVIIFDPWALGQWGTWRMSDLNVLIASVWAAQLIISPVWLRFFRFGPVEWAWRSLTYWRVQPLRQGSAAEAA